MEKQTIFYSKRICYEIKSLNKSFSIDVYTEGFADSKDNTQHCFIENFCEDIETATAFVKLLSSSCALPVHIPELAEEFLSV